jgi:repressor LexA
MLTRKQHELLTFIDKHLKETGVSPSFEEMKDALSLRSKSGIHRLITALEERGFLRRHHHRARALDVVRLPDNVPQPAARRAAKTDPAFTPQVIRGDFSGRMPGVRAANDAVAVQLPLYGRIAAGLPIEAMRDDGAHIEVPTAMLGVGDHFALEVAGDSMIDAGILDGDTVIIRKGETAETGAGRWQRGDAEAAAPPRELGGAGAGEPAA